MCWAFYARRSDQFTQWTNGSEVHSFIRSLRTDCTAASLTWAEFVQVKRDAKASDPIARASNLLAQTCWVCTESSSSASASASIFPCVPNSSLLSKSLSPRGKIESRPECKAVDLCNQLWTGQLMDGRVGKDCNMGCQTSFVSPMPPKYNSDASASS